MCGCVLVTTRSRASMPMRSHWLSSGKVSSPLCFQTFRLVTNAFNSCMSRKVGCSEQGADTVG